MITAPARPTTSSAPVKADLVLPRANLLREPYWPLRAASELARPCRGPPISAPAAPRGATERNAAHEGD